MTLWRYIKELLREMWFVPMFWPLMLLYEFSGWCGYNDVHWSVLVLSMVPLLPLVLVFTLLLLPVNVLVFAGILLWAPFALIIHLTKKVLAK